jgi:hypothetical protein
MEHTQYVNSMFRDLYATRSVYLLLREEANKKRRELARIAQRIELLGKLLALDAPDARA